MNNFIKKLSQREIGFVYIFLGLLLWFLPLNELFSSFKSFLIYLQIISPIISVISILLFVVGISKISKKEKQTDISDNREIPESKKASYVGPLIWIIAGILISTFVFWFNWFDFCGKSEECRWITLGISLFLFIPLIIFGVSFIIIGFVKLNKYLKYKKSQKQNISEGIK